MKRLSLIGCMLGLLLMLSATASAQEKKDQAFWNKFDEARLYIAKHNAGRSISILEELYAKDTLNPNVGYLSAVAKFVVGKQPKRAARLLVMADRNFDKLWDNPGVGPPEHLFYYMILAYCRSGACDKAHNALVRL